MSLYKRRHKYLPQCSAHGLRKAAASRLAELGGSVNEIMSITGHKPMSEVNRYTRAADQKRLAESVRKKWTGHKGNKVKGTDLDEVNSPNN